MIKSNHWYYPDGKPCYELPRKDGSGMKNPTIVDARKLGLVPSVTTIAKIIYSPGLEIWKADQIVKAAWDMGGYFSLTYEQWRDEVLEKADEISSTAADTGSEIHAAIDSFLTTTTISGPYSAWQKTFADWWIKQEWFGSQSAEIKTEGYISTEFGYGGRYDILVIFIFKGKVIIIDLKTQNSKGKPLKVYRSWGRQLAAYARPLKAGRLISVAIDSQDSSKIESYEWLDYEELLAEFDAAKLLWYSEHNLDLKETKSCAASDAKAVL